MVTWTKAGVEPTTGLCWLSSKTVFEGNWCWWAAHCSRTVLCTVTEIASGRGREEAEGVGRKGWAGWVYSTHGRLAVPREKPCICRCLSMPSPSSPESTRTPQCWNSCDYNYMLHFAGHVMSADNMMAEGRCGVSWVLLNASDVPAAVVLTTVCVGLFWTLFKTCHGQRHFQFMRNLLQQNASVYGSAEIWWINASKLRPIY